MSAKWKWVAVVSVAIVVGAGFYFGRPIVRSAGIAAEYVAKRACLCVFVSERDLVSCMIEMPELLGQVEAELLEEGRAVRARLSFLAESTARYSEDSGCTLD